MLSTRVKDFLKQHLHQSSRIIVGLSGGADSVALLLALHEAGADIMAAHCNFHLRGEESTRDQLHCEKLCHQLGIRLTVKHFDVMARRLSSSESVEMACRTLRYDWWRELIESGAGNYVAVGHHREDNIETFFLNLMRGCGIAGLKAMLPVSGYVIRPMLEETRADIEKYVTDLGYTWVDDRTNKENEYKRNRLRNIILPLIEKEFPGASDAMARTIDILRQNYSIYRTIIESASQSYKRDDCSIDVEGMKRSEGERYGALLHELLPVSGFNHSQIDDIIRCMEQKTEDDRTSSGQRFITPNGIFFLEKGVLAKAIDSSDDERLVDFGGYPFHAEEISITEFNRIKASSEFSANSMYVDAAAMDGNPMWTWRTWRQGDRLHPFGMKGTRLVSDIFTDAKFTANRKHSTPLLLRNGIIFWIAGLRASNHYKVTDETTSVIRITFEQVWNL